MNDVVQKILLTLATAIVSGTLSGAAVYTNKAVQLDGRISGIERALVRIESHIYRQPEPKADRQ